MISKVYEKDETELNGFLQKGKRSLFIVSSSTPNSEKFSPEQALNTNDTYFHTQGNFQHFYKISIFGFFYIKSYTILTRHNYIANLPFEWNVTASKDGISWTRIDYQNKGELNNVRVKKNYEVEHPGTYKHIKITQIKERDGSDAIFTFGAIDIFGKYIPDYLYFKTCQSKIRNHLFPFWLMLLIYHK